MVVALFAVSQADFSESISRDSCTILSLEDRQQLVRRTDCENHHCRRVRISESAIALIRFRVPRAVGLLVGEYGTNCARKKLLPIRAAHLIHALAAHE